MTYILMVLFAAGAVALDQWTKALTVANIPMYADVPFWDGLFHFTYVRNFGAAFSSFQGQQWLFALIFAVFTVFLLVDMIEVEFITFPVFNVADSFITCGCVLLIAHLIFFNKDFFKDEKK